ncbi:unnamed protein product [Effrenium voratum]|nr:unnamed protein product [Effrenium voratum]CAJ1437655.1 unnamed protein product [Effrenium voratum]
MQRALVLAVLAPLCAAQSDASLAGDDECAAEGCALNALQTRGQQALWADPEDFSDLDHWKVNESDENNTELGAQYADGFLAGMCHSGSYCAIGGYMIVAGQGSAKGMETIHGSNAGYYDSMMHAAYSRCTSGSCVLITNPVGHRTQSRFHIHYRHYNGAGSSLKHRLEKELCGKHGWHHFSECGSAKAQAYSHYPHVFSDVLGAYGGHLANVGVTVWPGSCGGGVIVLATTHCSIEHTISAR